MSTRLQVSVLAAVSIVLVAGVARADETGSPDAPVKAHNGGYGAPEVRVTSIAGSPGILFGSQGGWIHDHVFVLGGAGYGLVNDVTPQMGGAKSEALSLG